ncbi:glycoside hydrolase family 71 protein [Paraglaciecola sp. 2405UD69-4]|uniref:glycoside hydrolase family 71 protein n=1 Tax=Paraglaciecola sp. 2405UD69-4 TaxID=3391836 RepID=UPI0039C96F2A
MKKQTLLMLVYCAVLTGCLEVAIAHSTENNTLTSERDMNRTELPMQIPKLVFAHYFTPYPRSINNKVKKQSYYDANYLNPLGEKKKFLSKGGLLRSRPLYRPPIDRDVDWKLEDARSEVLQALAIGLDGFSMNLLSTTGYNWNRVLRMYDAAEDQGGFKILVMPDMNAVFKNYPERFVPVIQELAKRKASYRLPDGRLVISPYLAENQSPKWWRETLDELSSLGIEVALLPLYHRWALNIEKFKSQEPEAFKKYVIGTSEWGNRTPQYGFSQKFEPNKAHGENLIWMAPVAPQDSRPKSAIYTEAGNSDAYRSMWESAIQGKADWVQIITWNDYSESSQVAPATQTGYSFYDLTSYYINWFKSGSPPKIEKDIVFGFYREHHTEAVLSGKVQTKEFKVVGGNSPKNEIELLAFLTSPGILEIEINGKQYRQEATYGVTSFKIPLQEGIPIFKIIRNKELVAVANGQQKIDNSIDIQDFTYHGVSSLRQPKPLN